MLLPNPPNSELQHLLLELCRSDFEKERSIEHLEALAETNDQLRVKNEELATLLEAQDDKSLSLTIRLFQKTEQVLQNVRAAQEGGAGSSGGRPADSTQRGR